MKDQDCVDFLRWAVPRMGFRWAGFRKVRGQVCKRIRRRLVDLGLADVEGYRAQLAADEDEWRVLDAFCRITISRFHRDRVFFEHLARRVLPALARSVIDRGGEELRMWSAGCGAGEEPYTLAMIARLASAPELARVEPRIVATDSNPRQLERAETAVYPASTLAELPLRWREAAFDPLGDGSYRLRYQFQETVELTDQDLREESPDLSFHLVLCRNLAFTYFAEELQLEVLERIRSRLAEGGVLGIGAHESLPRAPSDPASSPGFEPWPEAPGLFRRT